MKKTNNKGFSLVELIVVIAIMAVLVGVLAPTFTKYVEQSRRSTDIQNAEAIKTAVLADIADGDPDFAATSDTTVTIGTASGQVMPSTMTEAPLISGNINKGANFTVTYNATAGTCKVFNGTYELTDATAAATYKTATAAPATP